MASPSSSLGKFASVAGILAFVVGAGISCSAPPAVRATPDASTPTNIPPIAPPPPPPGAADGSGGGIIIKMDAPSSDGPCTPARCDPPGGRYCGVVGDNCGGRLDCLTCPGDWSCEKNVCVGGPSCQPVACTVPGARYCGKVGDGCGRELDCGDCPAGDTCTDRVCVPPGCIPLRCDFAGGRFCGKMGNGCGGTLECGDCAAPNTCGGGGLSNICGGDPSCVKVSCAPATGGRYCDKIGDGCGGAQECGPCPDGKACGSGNVPNVCPGNAPTTCSGLACKVAACDGGMKTSVSGTVYDPAGANPLYNVIVYIPNAALDPVPEGASCDGCNGTLSGKPITTALTDTSGHFTLVGAPTGTDIPLVIQIGKWRREITIPNVASCVDNPIADKNLTRLPRDSSEGHIPKMAIATGGSDALECLVRKIGIADAEFTNGGGTGRVNLFSGYAAPTTMANGTALATANSLWSDAAKLKSYDMMIMSCEGSDNVSRTTAQYANVHAYADMGGRIFGSHWHNGWINPENTPFPMVVKFSSGAHGFTTPITGTIDTTFPKGMAFADWLVKVGASTTPQMIEIRGAEHTVDSVMPGLAQRWIYGTDTEKNTPMVQYFSFNAPVGGQACGRMVFSDVHVSAGAGTDSGKVPFPTGCTTTTLSPQEKALEFMIFDLSSCVQPDSDPVKPPPSIPGTPPPPVSVPPPPPPVPPPPPLPPPK
jgi:hypothetical protein